MAKRRRRLNPLLEQEISSAKRKIELVTAIINDIEDEEIQGEYRLAFAVVKSSFINLSSLYDEVGFNNDTESALENYKLSIKVFENEYEI